MRLKVPDNGLWKSLMDVYGDAILYCKFLEKDADNEQDRLFAAVAIKEFTIGRDMLDMLVDSDEEVFLTPEAATTIMQSLLNFRAAIDGKQFPLMSWRIMDAVIQSQQASCIYQNEDDEEAGPSRVLH